MRTLLAVAVMGCVICGSGCAATPEEEQLVSQLADLEKERINLAREISHQNAKIATLTDETEKAKNKARIAELERNHKVARDQANAARRQLRDAALVAKQQRRDDIAEWIKKFITIASTVTGLPFLAAGTKGGQA